MGINRYEESFVKSSEAIYATASETSWILPDEEKASLLIKRLAVVEMNHDGGTLKVYSTIQIFFIEFAQFFGLCTNISFKAEKIRERLISIRYIFHTRIISPYSYTLESSYEELISKMESMIVFYNYEMGERDKGLPSLKEAPENLNVVTFDQVFEETTPGPQIKIELADPYAPCPEFKANLAARRKAMQNAKQELSDFNLESDDVLALEYASDGSARIQTYSPRMIRFTKLAQRWGFYRGVNFDKDKVDEKLAAVINLLSSVYINGSMNNADQSCLTAIETACDYIEMKNSGADIAEMSALKKTDLKYRRFQAFTKASQDISKIRKGRTRLSDFSRQELAKIERIMERQRAFEREVFFPTNVG